MKNKTAFIILLAAAVVILFLSVGIGSVFIPPNDILLVIGNQLFGMHNRIDESVLSIIWEIRLPRVLLSFLVGASLSAGGAVAQSVLKNPLASPYTLGVSSGASLGAGIIIVTGFTIPLIGNFTLPLTGLAFGVITVVLAVMLAQKVDINLGSSTIVLTGMIFSLFMNAVLTLIAGLSNDKYQIIMRWQMGTFSSKGWDYLKILLPVSVVCIMLFIFFSKEMDILTFGEEQASTIGVDTKKIKWLLLILVAVLSGTSVAFAGVIGFIDLIAPHVVRKLFSSRHKIVIPISALLGGTFMMACDLISRTVVSPHELSIGVVTALAGAPFFAYIYLRGRKSNA